MLTLSDPVGSFIFISLFRQIDSIFHEMTARKKKKKRLLLLFLLELSVIKAHVFDTLQIYSMENDQHYISDFFDVLHFCFFNIEVTIQEKIFIFHPFALLYTLVA